MRFRFAYAPLLDRCEQAETVCRETLALAQARAAEARCRLADCERQRDAAYRAITGDDPLARAWYRFVLDSAAAARTAYVASEESASSARASYFDARRETHRITLLRERAAAQFTRAAECRAARELDDANADLSPSRNERNPA